MISTALVIAAATACVLFSVANAICIVYLWKRAETPRLRKLEASVSEWTDYLVGAAAANEKIDHRLKKLDARLRARNNRHAAKQEGDDGAPDPQKDPAGWKREMMTRYPRGVFSMSEH